MQNLSKTKKKKKKCIQRSNENENVCSKQTQRNKPRKHDGSMTVQPDASIWLACVFPHSCHSALICFLIPAYMALSPSCLGLSPPVPRCLCLLSLSLCLDLPPVTLSHRGDRVVCPFKLQTLSLTDREKRGLGPSERGNTQGPPRLTSTNWLATPTRLILLRFSHQCPLPLPHNVKERIRALAKIVGNYQTQKRTCAQFFLMCFALVCT